MHGEIQGDNWRCGQISNTVGTVSRTLSRERSLRMHRRRASRIPSEQRSLRLCWMEEASGHIHHVILCGCDPAGVGSGGRLGGGGWFTG